MSKYALAILFLYWFKVFEKMDESTELWSHGMPVVFEVVCGEDGNAQITTEELQTFTVQGMSVGVSQEQLECPTQVSTCLGPPVDTCITPCDDATQNSQVDSVCQGSAEELSAFSNDSSVILLQFNPEQGDADNQCVYEFVNAEVSTSDVTYVTESNTENPGQVYITNQCSGDGVTDVEVMLASQSDAEAGDPRKIKEQEQRPALEECVEYYYDRFTGERKVRYQNGCKRPNQNECEKWPKNRTLSKIYQTAKTLQSSVQSVSFCSSITWSTSDICWTFTMSDFATCLQVDPSGSVGSASRTCRTM